MPNLPQIPTTITSLNRTAINCGTNTIPVLKPISNLALYRQDSNFIVDMNRTDDHLDILGLGYMPHIMENTNIPYNHIHNR